MVAVTSSGLAARSTSVPTWPGAELVGRDELDGVSVRSNSGSISSRSSPAAPEPNAWSTAEPR